MHLPVELVRAILEHLADDKASLSALSSVSRVWRVLSFELLFESARIVHSPASKEAAHSLPDFTAFIAAAPVPASSIRALHLVPGSGCREVAALDLGVLHSCLDALSGLHRLQLSSVATSPHMAPPCTRLARPNLDLTIHNPRTTFPHNTDALAVLDLFASLRLLCISQLMQPFWPEHDDRASGASLAPRPRVVVRALKIQHTQAPAADQCLWMLRTRLIPSCVESFEYRAADSSALVALDPHIRALGAGLRACSLDLVPFSVFVANDEIPCLMRMPSLASCPDLQSLRLSLSLPLSTRQRDRAALLLRHCLYDIVACAPSLCELELVFHVDPARSASEADVEQLRAVARLMPWTALDAIVKSLLRLNDVCIEFRNGQHGSVPWFSRELCDAVHAQVSKETMRCVRVV